MNSLPGINCTLKEANVYTKGNQLIINTGSLQRIWQLVDNGLSTLEITNTKSEQIWKSSTSQCDWQLPDGSTPTTAQLLSLKANIQDDEGFTSEHISVRAEITTTINSAPGFLFLKYEIVEDA